MFLFSNFELLRRVGTTEKYIQNLLLLTSDEDQMQSTTKFFHVCLVTVGILLVLVYMTIENTGKEKIWILSWIAQLTVKKPTKTVCGLLGSNSLRDY